MGCICNAVSWIFPDECRFQAMVAIFHTSGKSCISKRRLHARVSVDTPMGEPFYYVGFQTLDPVSHLHFPGSAARYFTVQRDDETSALGH
jgi:hypothetical protein